MFSQVNVKNYNFIDLFAGAGGLSEGFFQAGFNPIAHVEMNPDAAKTIETRMCYYYLKKIGNLEIYYNYLQKKIGREKFLEYIPQNVIKTVIAKEMSDKTLPDIFAQIDSIMEEDKISEVDVVVGGPPCQAYSLVGRAQSSHMGVPMKADPRNRLYLLYTRVLKKYNPKMFVFENVLGITSANNGHTWRNIKAQMRRVGYDIDCHIQNAFDFGVMQNRRRMIIIGWRKNSPFGYPEFPKISYKSVVNDLLHDLPSLKPNESSSKYNNVPISKYMTELNLRTKDDILTLHVSRPNTERDIEIYKHVIELWNDNHRRLHYNDLPDNLKTHRNRTAFTDRFKIVEGDERFCHTILAHLSKDGHYFIHPDINQHRSITVREAARIQSFPDNYFFEGTRTAQFVQVGNAVPPLMAKTIASEIYEQLRKEENNV